MKELYEDYTEKFEIIRRCAEKYELKEIADKTTGIIESISGFQVIVPLVGGFSTGKSSLLNYILNQDILSVNITPETAIPTEIEYGKNTVQICKSDNTIETIDLNDYIQKRLSVKNIDKVVVQIDNSFLNDISSVRIIDMPGFDSGIEQHNKVIDDYLPNSLAYIITVSAEEGTLRESIVNLLSELSLNSMPVYIVVTKVDKIMPDDIENVKNIISYQVKKCLKLDEIKIVSSSIDDDIGKEDVKSIFKELQDRSNELFKKYYSNKLLSLAYDLYNYMKFLLNKRNTTNDQLELDKENLEKSIKKLREEYLDKKESFKKQLEDSIESIKAKVAFELNNSVPTVETMLLQNQNPGDKLNLIVRTVITSEINRTLDRKINIYISDISNIISENITVMDTSGTLLSPEKEAENQNLKDSLDLLVQPAAQIVTTIATTALTTALSDTVAGAMLGSLLGPLGIVIGIAAGTLIGSLINKGVQEKRENERRNAAHEKAVSIVKDVIQNAGTQIEKFIYELFNKINDEIEVSITEKIEIQQRGLEEAVQKIKLNESEKNTYYKELNQYISDIQILIDSENKR